MVHQDTHLRRSLVALLIAIALVLLAQTQTLRAQDKPKDVRLPKVPAGFRVGLFAAEPKVRNPAAMAFDSRGRMFVGQGPQFRNPRPDTPGDSIKILIDDDDDGVADREKTFATGFNCIQSLAFKGRDLWVANSPDLTVVRDLNGDDVADEYVRVYTDLGNLEHGIHGLNWGPDGKLYMSKGNSKGLTRPGRIAPLPFRQLWDVRSPPNSPDMPPPRVFKKGQYKKAYHDPADDWRRQGGVLRCDEMGRNLEIVARGFRNPWDITFDGGFNWLGTDNDQNQGDKIFMPFYGGHFGWGHNWSSQWNGRDHLPTAPPSGPLFEGSGTGIVYCASDRFPPRFCNVFFIDDWLGGVVYIYRPKWDGALLQNATPGLEVFARADGALFKPSDVEVGPDGALYVLGWGHGYGATFDDGKQTNEGRVFRIWHEATPPLSRKTWREPKRSTPHARWTMQQLVADLGHHIPAWRVDAQQELVRRGVAVKGELIHMLGKPNLSTAQQTWIAWTLGRIAPQDASIDRFFADRIAAKDARSLNLRIQAIRIVAHRLRQRAAKPAEKLPATIVALLADPQPRIRFEAVQAVWQTRQRHLIDVLAGRAAVETDRITFYSIWGALGELADAAKLREMLQDKRGGVRRAALLALLDMGLLKTGDVLAMRLDDDPGVAAVTALWLSKVGGKKMPLALVIDLDGGDFAESIAVTLTGSVPNTIVRYTLDGAEPAENSPRYEKPLSLKADAILKAALFRDGKRLGPVIPARFHRFTEDELLDQATAVNIKAASKRPYKTAQGLARGKRLYIDRQYTFTDVPETLAGVSYIMGANDDSPSVGERFLSFTVVSDAIVYLAHDRRDAKKPAWMKVGRSGGFRDAGFDL